MIDFKDFINPDKHEEEMNYNDTQTYIKVVYQTDVPHSVVTEINPYLSEQRLEYLKSLGTVKIYECAKDTFCEIVEKEL